MDENNRLPEEKILRAYQVFGSLRKAGEVLGISYQTVRRCLKEHGAEMKPVGAAYRKGKRYVAGHRGVVARLLREHPEVRLPRSYEGIQRLIKEKLGEEASLDSIRTYLYRRRKAEKERMKELGDLRKLSGLLRLVDGRSVPFRAIDSYEMKLDYHTFRYKISGVLRTGEEFRAEVRYEDIA
jgi:molybdenum-dependent DNA-binding transcriptional regulator ModE